MLGTRGNSLRLLVLVAICGVSLSSVHAQESSLTLDLVKTISLDGNLEHREWNGAAPIIRYSPAGKWLAARWADKIFILDASTYEVTYTIDSPNYVGRMRFSQKDNEFVVFNPSDQTLLVWNMKTGQPLGKLKLDRPPRELEFHPKSGAIIYGAERMGPSSNVGLQPHSIMVQGWPNGPSGSFPLPDEFQDFYAFAVQPGDGRYIAVASGSGVYVIDSKRNKFLHEWKFFERWPGVNTQGASLVPALNLDFSPDGQYLYIDYQYGPSRLVEVESGETVSGFDKTSSPKYWSGTFSPDGRTIAAIGYKPGTLDSNKVVILDASNGKPLVQLATGEVLKDPKQLAFSPDGLTLAVTNEEICAIQIFSIPDLSELLPPVDEKKSSNREKTKKDKKKKDEDTDEKNDKPKPAVAGDEVRTWAVASGSATVKARFVSQDETTVTLMKSDGSNVTVKKKILSAQDQDYLESLKKK